MTITNRQKSIVIRGLLTLVLVSMLSACDILSTQDTASANPSEKAEWGFKWDDGSVWQ